MCWYSVICGIFNQVLPQVILYLYSMYIWFNKDWYYFWEKKQQLLKILQRSIGHEFCQENPLWWMVHWLYWLDLMMNLDFVVMNMVILVFWNNSDVNLVMYEIET